MLPKVKKSYLFQMKIRIEKRNLIYYYMKVFLSPCLSNKKTIKSLQK